MTEDLQPTSYEIWETKYQLSDEHGKPVDKNINDTYNRVAAALSISEKNQPYWTDQFNWALRNGATPAGRILSNAGAQKYKPATSLINCTVSEIVTDSMEGILQAVKQAGLTLTAGCGIGYEFSTLRPRNAFVSGAGAYTSGPITFMDIFDKMCFTVSSAGGRRGAQMGTFAIWHPDVEEFINAKREDGRLRQFNLSLLIDNEFMEAVKSDSTYDLVFPVKRAELDKGLVTKKVITKKRFWEEQYCIDQDYVLDGEGNILCMIHKTINAKELWNTIMMSTYDFSEPGFLLIDKINAFNPNYFCEEIRATNPCGEQPLPPEGSCLLGSINVAKFVNNPFTDNASFDWAKYKKVIKVFTRMLDNVVEHNGLPLSAQRAEIEYKRRHGMGITGIGSALSLLGDTYGSESSIKFAEDLMKKMAVVGFEAGIDLAVEKGPAPIFNDLTDGVDNKKLWCDGLYMQKIWSVAPELRSRAMTYGCRFTHHTSIAPTGTISLSVNNNVSNGIEPSFSHKYTRNVIVTGKKSKKAVNVYSYEMLKYKEVTGLDSVPSAFSTSDNVSTYAHVDIQAAAQRWTDSSISKTINVPSDIAFEDFKDIYLYAYENDLKGCTTFRFNAEAFQGVLVTEENLAATTYKFTTDVGEIIHLSGADTIMYDGEEHSAANLYDALKEGYYGKL